MQTPTPVGEEQTRDPWISPRDPLHFLDLAPADRFCDLILTGGVTSAVAYPGLVAVLASAYRFQAIGGSSSGAGIAAIAAAAEFRRRHGSAEGFRVMLERLQLLEDEDWLHRTRLLHLFQPARQHRLLFDLLKRTFSSPGKEFRAFALALLRLSWPTLVIVFGLTASWMPGTPVGWAAAVGWTLILTVVVVVLRLVFALRRVVGNDYGVCTGLAPSGKTDADRPPLTVWLHSVIQEVAGRSHDEPPLTFADLARAPGSPRAVLGAGKRGSDKGISLQMFSANVTHGRPYRFPLQDDEQLYFRPSELRRVLPATVVDHLLAGCKARPGACWDDDVGEPDEHARWRLPGPDMPVILAARMSVSFPVLFTVVRLWAPGADRLDLHPCVFMDGGLCSNFPIHLFDSALPAWPTFGASLHDKVEKRGAFGKDRGPHGDAEVFLPPDVQTGSAELRYDFDGVSKPGGRLAGLIGALLATVKDWNDASTSRMWGVWDRVVRIQLTKGEGGLNIAMRGVRIRSLSHKGVVAGRLLLERFSEANAPNGMSEDWNSHRWTRLIRLLAALGRHLDGFAWSAAPGRHAEDLAAQIERRIEARELSQVQGAALRKALDALAQAEEALNAPETSLPELSPPQPELRVRAPL